MKAFENIHRLAFIFGAAFLAAVAFAQDAPIVPPAITPAQPPTLPPVVAADAAVAAATPAGAASYGMSLAQAWGYGGFIMWVLLGISVLMVALVIYFLCVFSMVVPFQMVMYTLSKTADKLRLNTPWTIPIVYLGFGAGLAVFMFVGFVKSIPLEIEEAASVDGCLSRRLRAVKDILRDRIPYAQAHNDLCRHIGDHVDME